MGEAGRLRSRLREHPLAVDSAVAVVVALIALFGPDPAAMTAVRAPDLAHVVVAAACAALLVRRARPLPVLGVTLAAYLAAVLLQGGVPGLPLAVGVALYSVSVHVDRRTTVMGWSAVAVAVVACTVLSASRGGLSASGGGLAATGEGMEVAVRTLFSTLTMTGVFAAVGDAVRSHRTVVAAVEERALRAERSRDEEARRRVAEERLRIARELHDVVAHHVAVVSVQAGVAGHLLDTRPTAARAALEHVQQASASILDELGGILSVLRNPGDGPVDEAPAPGLAQLDALVASYAGAGLEVTWSSAGTPHELTDAVDLVAYRVVQESLTNAQRYGTGRASVDIRYTGSGVDVQVSNPVRDGLAATGSGFGLVGMRERATAVGGALQAGRTSGGTFRVTASLPGPPARAR